MLVLTIKYHYTIMIKEIKYNRDKLKIIKHLSYLIHEDIGDIYLYFSPNAIHDYSFCINHHFETINIISDYLLGFHTEILCSTINEFLKLDNYTISTDVW